VIPAAVRATLRELLQDRVRFDVPLAQLTSLCVGGPADAVATPSDRAELAALLGMCGAQRIPHHLIGSGFNTLASDAPLAGIVVQLSRLRVLEERPGGRLRAETGVSHSQVTRFCTQRGLSGLEFAAGIPGSVGGWLAMNAGIPAREMKDVVVEVEVMSPTGCHIRHLERGALRFAYRALRGLAPGSVLLSALFQVSPSDPQRVRAQVDQLLARRASTQPLNVRSCGSVFKNPRGDYAGRLIESVGLKGYRIGGAEISPVHANFITNTGDASASDVLALICEARKRVRERTGARLAREVRVLGGHSR
jgi:UDP-N-acetylmuramate dehydrogenase